ncbi:MAG TPA: endonuclease/exonuclease/phosphatase family protein [Candidatus Krumholzibacteriaceae bacterium]|nr:endonuclease/exonuclease/phosphatase family protein [Candidatus Krumholzibacteriaceae bacterium]
MKLSTTISSPPKEIKDELDKLCEVLDKDVPAKIPDRNLLIATWNIRAFGGLTESWKAEEKDNPKRDFHALRCIAEIVSRFDVIALQEVKGDLKSLRHMLKLLGPEWGFILTDVTKGAAGNDERMAFVFDTRKVRISGLACELVVPQEQLAKVGPDALSRQFARTPYAVSFWSAGKTFILVTLHVIYGEKAKERVPELKAIAEWMSDWAKTINEWDHNLIALGDFNIDRKDDELYKAFTSTGLFVPKDLQKLPRTIFSDPNKPDLNQFYDQIAWFMGENKVPALSLKYSQGGNFDFTKAALSSLNLTKQQLSWRISDHYPLWVEFQVRE